MGVEAFMSGVRIPGWTELPAPSAPRCPKCHLRYGVLARTVFTNAKLPLYKIIKIVEVMWHSASPRLIGLTCKASHSTTFL